jgi:hypothetical protein
VAAISGRIAVFRGGTLTPECNRKREVGLSLFCADGAAQPIRYQRLVVEKAGQLAAWRVYGCEFSGHNLPEGCRADAAIRQTVTCSPSRKDRFTSAGSAGSADEIKASDLVTAKKTNSGF